jgi:murein DD-endopeptidase MepM/ murein hydrolase activator NlpD
VVKRGLGTVLISVSVIAGALTPARPAFADAISDAQARQNQINNQISQDKAALANVRDQQARTQAQLRLLGDEISLTQSNLAAQSARLDGILGDIDRAQRDLAAKKVEEAQRKDLLNRRMRSLYKEQGSTSFLDAVLTAKNFSELMNRFIVMRDITRQDELLLQQIQADRAAIESLNAELSRKRDEQATVVNNIKDQNAALQAQYVQYNVVRAQLASQAAALEEQQRQAEAARAAVAAEIAALVSARSRAHSSGIFAWPGVQGPITQGFGCSSLRGEPSPKPPYSCPPSAPWFHEGIDIGGPSGGEIDAADGGIAYTKNNGGGYGQYVLIVHANGFTTIYGHMLAYAIHPGAGGQQVSKGQAIGYEGSTGFSTGAHLHFGVYLNNFPVDPCRYVGC